MEWVRIKDKTTGHESTVTRTRAERIGAQIIDKPATDSLGRPLPPKSSTDKAGRPAAPKSTKENA